MPWILQQVNERTASNKQTHVQTQANSVSFVGVGATPQPDNVVHPKK
jgi:hypothetical protein